MGQKFRHILYTAAACWIILAGCAKVMPLTGGDQDKTPPAYRSSTPDTFSLNFKGKAVIIKFDEFINLKDPTHEILVSPPVYPAPEFILNGQAVKIKFKDSLLPNITYVIQFGKSIEDITEGNVNTGFSFVFSTGPYLDSGVVAGNIADAFTGKPSEGFKVMLYKPDVSDSFPYKEKPFYLAYTDAGGNFRLGNLRKGDYRIFALKEDNNNYLYDREGEEIAFLPHTVSTGDTLPLKLVSFKEETGKVKFMKGKSVSPVRTELYFQGRAAAVKARPYFGFPDSAYFAYEFNTAQDTMTLWHYPIAADSFGVFIDAPNLSDTVVLKTNRAAQPALTGGKRARSGPQAMMVLNAAGNFKFDLYSPPVLTFTEPLKRVDTSLVHLLADSVPVPFGLKADSVSPRKLLLTFPVAEKKKYTLVCDSAAFTEISGKVSVPTSYAFGFRTAVEYGSVNIVYQDSLLKYPKIWQLLKEDRVIRETFTIANLNNVKFGRLEPGTYKLRLIIDNNENKKWDTGQFMTGTQPEKVLYMSDPVELKPGWDAEIIWKMVKPRTR